MSKCNFCDMPPEDCGPLIEGGSEDNKAYICFNCIEQGRKMRPAKLVRNKRKRKDVNLPNPKEIVSKLDQYICGQEAAKRDLAVSVYNHYIRLFDYDLKDTIKGSELEDTVIDKNNVLMVGPTGSGKTLLASTLASIIDVPFAIGDATTVTEAGYVGEDVENLLLKLIRAADMDIESAEHGILYIDEIDKIGRTSGNRSITRDVSGEGVQQSLLKLLEGTVANVPPAGGRKHPEQEFLQVDTSNILFICGGTFSGLGDIVKKRICSEKNKIGFGNYARSIDEKDYSIDYQAEDLFEYGLIPEFVGRLPSQTFLEELSEEKLIHVLTEPKNSLLKQYQKQFLYSGINLKFTKKAVAEIAKIAHEQKTGARALRTIVSGIMNPIVYDIFDIKRKELTIDDKIVRGEKKAVTTKVKAA